MTWKQKQILQSWNERSKGFHLPRLSFLALFEELDPHEQIGQLTCNGRIYWACAQRRKMWSGEIKSGSWNARDHPNYVRRVKETVHRKKIHLEAESAHMCAAQMMSFFDPTVHIHFLHNPIFKIKRPKKLYHYSLRVFLEFSRKKGFFSNLIILYIIIV